MALSTQSKGKGPVSANFAKGGEEITTKSRFLKVPDSFRTGQQKNDFAKKGKGGTLSEMEGETKVEKVIKPRS